MRVTDANERCKHDEEEEKEKEKEKEEEEKQEEEGKKRGGEWTKRWWHLRNEVTEEGKKE